MSTQIPRWHIMHPGVPVVATFRQLDYRVNPLVMNTVDDKLYFLHNGAVKTVKAEPTDPTLVALAALDATTGLLEQTAADTFTKRALGVAAGTSVPTRTDADGRYVLQAQTASRVMVTDGSGVVGTDAELGFDGSNLVIAKTSGIGIKVEPAAPTFPWRDMIGPVHVRSTGSSDPLFNVYRGGLRQYQFNAANEVFLEFHIPHDYVLGSDIHLHFHWSTNGTTRTGGAAGTITGGTLTWGAEVTYAKGHNQAAFGAPVTFTVVSATAPSTLYQHIITEGQLSAASPAASQIDSDDIEPDGVILLRAYLSANNITVSSGNVPAPFLHFVDIHYQSTNIGTKAKAPNFYS